MSIALVGAGLGSVDGLTIKARAVLEAASLVVADDLISPDVLALVKGRIVCSGKKTKGQQSAQQSINAIALEALRNNESVVRLKCGDPMLFGRGAEELLFFRAHGYEPTVVPGICSAIAAPALVGIPVTHRGLASQVLILTAHGQDGAFPSIPAFDAQRTLVFLMCVKRMPRIAEELVTTLHYPDTLPAAVIERAATRAERVFKGTLANISAIAARAGVTSPATLVVGHTVHATEDYRNTNMLDTSSVATHTARVQQLAAEKRAIVRRQMGVSETHMAAQLAGIDGVDYLSADESDSDSDDDDDDDDAAANADNSHDHDEPEDDAAPSRELDSDCDPAPCEPAVPLAARQLFTPEHLARLNAQLEKMSLDEVLRWCIMTLPGLAQVTSFGASGSVIAHALAQLKATLPTIFLDTFYHFPETLQLAETSRQAFDLDLHVYSCDGVSTRAEFEREFNDTQMWLNDAEQYYELVKVEPMQRAFDELNVSAWINGRRRDQGAQRTDLHILELDAADGRLKINPLAFWSLERIWAYIRLHKVPYNKLYDMGYKSIGDVHSTKRTLPGESERSGRVFSASDAQKTECGIHARNPEREKRLLEIAARRKAKALAAKATLVEQHV